MISARSALHELLALGHNYIGTEHLLLGILAEGTSEGARAIGELGITPGPGSPRRSTN